VSPPGSPFRCRKSEMEFRKKYLGKVIVSLTKPRKKNSERNGGDGEGRRSLHNTKKNCWPKRNGQGKKLIVQVPIRQARREAAQKSPSDTETTLSFEKGQKLRKDATTEEAS